MNKKVDMDEVNRDESRFETVQEAEFKTTYVANFLATYMAINYDADCMKGHPTKRYEHQPVEDAIFNADCAWNSLKNQDL